MNLYILVAANELIDRVAFECNVLDSKRVCVAGLVHDTGHMVMSLRIQSMGR